MSLFLDLIVLSGLVVWIVDVPRNYYASHGRHPIKTTKFVIPAFSMSTQQARPPVLDEVASALALIPLPAAQP